MENAGLIQNYIMHDMAEGVMTIGFSGKITYLNPAAEQILEISGEHLLDRPFAACFFEYEQNDAFNQMILDAVYDRKNTHEGIADYYTGEKKKQLRIRTSFLTDGAEPVGIICVLSDVTELAELRDAMKAMELIKAANDRLEMRNRLLSETFGRFLSDEIVKQLLDTPDGLALGGKKECLTVMMSDLRGFTSLSENMDPQELLTMLNHYLGIMTEKIQHYGGTILEFIGDGIMAVFGAPAYFEDHASKAVAAAVEMQTAMREVNEWNRGMGFPELEMGIGINTGSIVIGNIGSEKRTKYGVTGTSVNLAGRIESYTVGGQILVSDEVIRHVKEELTVEETMEVTPKGVSLPMTLSLITGIGLPYGLSCESKVSSIDASGSQANEAQSDPLKNADKQMKKLSPFEKPKTVTVKMVKGKQVEPAGFKGYLTSVSEDRALLRCDAKLEVFDNVELSRKKEDPEEKRQDGPMQRPLPSKILAKVVRAEEEGYVIRFTSVGCGWLDE